MKYSPNFNISEKIEYVVETIILKKGTKIKKFNNKEDAIKFYKSQKKLWVVRIFEETRWTKTHLLHDSIVEEAKSAVHGPRSTFRRMR